MLIVLEGVDGVGKTTLATLLSKTLNAGIVHATRDTPNTWAWFSELMDLAKSRNLILDRAFWGQFVYQEPDDRKLTHEQLHDLEHRLHQEGGHLIYVTANDADIWSRLNKRQEPLALPLNVLKTRYWARVSAADCPVLVYNTSTGEVT